MTSLKLFTVINDEVKDMKEVKFGEHKFQRLVCMLTCFQAAVFGGQPFAEAEQLLTKQVSSKLGVLNLIASAMTFKIAEKMAQYGSMHEFAK